MIILEGGNFKKKQFIIVPIIIIFLIIIVLLSGYFDNSGSKIGYYEINFSRDYITTNERIAIEKAEQINYSSVLFIPRFDENGTYPNFIDFEVIDDFFDVEIINRYGDSFHISIINEEVKVYYEYLARARYYPELKISVEKIFPSYELGLSLNGKNYTEIINEDNYFDIKKETTIIAYKSKIVPLIVIDSKYDYYYKEFNLSLEYSDVYLIEMILEFNVHWAPLAGVDGYTSQLVVLNKNYDFEMIIVNPSEHGVS
jgi:hypothetical protein